MHKGQTILKVAGHLDWQHMLAFYRLRAIHSLETITDTHYQRSGLFDEVRYQFCLTQHDGNSLILDYQISDTNSLPALIQNIREMFDLDCDTHSVEQHLSKLEPELIKVKGLRIPGVWSIWEAGVRAILGQQVSVKAAINHLNNLVDTISSQDFPTPTEVAQTDLSFLRMPESRKQTLARYAEYMCQHPDSMPNEWLALKGIGPWTVQYAELRGERIKDCFVEGDLIVKKRRIDYPNLNKQSVSPWGSYATLHLWNQ